MNGEYLPVQIGKGLNGEAEEEAEGVEEAAQADEDPFVAKADDGSKAPCGGDEVNDNAIASDVGDDGKTARSLKVLANVGLWFFFSISIGIGTKWVFLYGKICDADGSCVTYKFPFALTAVHMLISWLVCSLILWGRPTRAAECRLGRSEYLKKIVPLALAFAGSVSLGNVALKYIYPSFSHMLGSLSPLVTVWASMAMRAKRYNVWTWVSMPIICGGLLACSKFEANYDVLGVLCVVGSTALRAVKSIMQEELLDTNERAKLDTISLLYHFCPWAMAFLALLSLCVEGLEPLSILVPTAANDGKTGVSTVLLLVAASGLVACFMNICATSLTATVGAVMVQIIGNVKGCATVVVSALVLRNEVAPFQMLGMAACLTGVWIYQQKGGAVKADVVPGSTATEGTTATPTATPTAASIA